MPNVTNSRTAGKFCGFFQGLAACLNLSLAFAYLNLHSQLHLPFKIEPSFHQPLDLQP